MGSAVVGRCPGRNRCSSPCRHRATADHLAHDPVRRHQTSRSCADRGPAADPTWMPEEDRGDSSGCLGAGRTLVAADEGQGHRKVLRTQFVADGHRLEDRSPVVVAERGHHAADHSPVVGAAVEEVDADGFAAADSHLVYDADSHRAAAESCCCYCCCSSSHWRRRWSLVPEAMRLPRLRRRSRRDRLRTIACGGACSCSSRWRRRRCRRRLVGRLRSSASSVLFAALLPPQVLRRRRQRRAL